jgi:hypothetical protein
MYGFNNYNTNYNMYYNQQQLYQQHTYDYLPEGSMQPTHHQQYQMYNPGFMANQMSVSHNNYNMMHTLNMMAICNTTQPTISRNSIMLKLSKTTTHCLSRRVARGALAVMSHPSIINKCAI